MIIPPTPPEGIIRLIHVRFDSNYNHVFDFKSKEEKADFFTKIILEDKDDDGTLYKLEFKNCSYIRKNGSLKVPIHIDKLNRVNYLMYKNPQYINKWYYCFVVQKNYINDNCTELILKTDVFQTWYTEANFHPSFIEREHIMVDRPGANLVPEGLETGEFVAYKDFDLPNEYFTPIPCIAFTGNKLAGWAVNNYATTVNGIMTCIPYIVCKDMNTGISLMDTINQEGQGDKIFTAFTVPKLAVFDLIRWFTGIGHTWYNANGNQPEVKILDVERPEHLENYYTPRNKKLLTYPYCYLGFNAPNGSSKIYRFENFGNGIQFYAISEVNPNPTVVIYPKYYLHKENSVQDAVTINGYPTLSYRNDYYNTWLAQNSGTINLSIDRSYFNYDVAMKYNENAQNRENTNAMLNAISATVGTVANALTLNLGGAVNSAVGGVQNYINSGFNMNDLKLGEYTTAKNLQYDLRAIQANKEKQQMLPDTGSLSSSNATLLGYNMIKKACFSMYSVKSVQARRLDQYFDMFGYQTNEVKIPNRSGRKSWNYVKTMGVNITGNIPEDDRQELCSIFDSGVTIWHYPARMYNYSLNNESVV